MPRQQRRPDAEREAGPSRTGLFGMLPLAFAQLLQDRWLRRQRLSEAGGDRRPGASYTASGLGDSRCTKAASPTPSGFSSRAPQRTGREEPGPGRRQVRGARLRARPAGREGRPCGGREGAGKQPGREDPVPGARCSSRPVRPPERHALRRSRRRAPAGTQAYALIVDGLTALQNGNPRRAIKDLPRPTLCSTRARALRPGTGVLGSRRVHPGRREFDRCIKRRGERWRCSWTKSRRSVFPDGLLLPGSCAEDSRPLDSRNRTART